MIKQTVYTILFCYLLLSCKESEVASQRIADLVLNVHLTLENPSIVATDINNCNNYLIEKLQYTQGTPNWVSWHVSKDWLGNALRQDDFRADNTLPADWYKVGASAYMGSGFDRGHNIPSADRTKTTEDNSTTFLMTNMIPQAHEHNRGIWANLEEPGRLYKRFSPGW